MALPTRFTERLFERFFSQQTREEAAKNHKILNISKFLFPCGWIRITQQQQEEKML
jgi:hypothetical protein